MAHRKYIRLKWFILEYKIVRYAVKSSDRAKWGWRIRKKYWYEKLEGGHCKFCGTWTETPVGAKAWDNVKCGNRNKGESVKGCGRILFV
jgi:hypothetical protein